MRILALILARSGSKRLPGKNIRLLGGKPLIVWSIDVAKDIPEICDILISTDAVDIATICQQAGAYVPWLRPPELATDTTSSVEAALHALDWYEAEKGIVDGVILLQPTSPFRTKKSVQRGIELYKKHNYQSVLGVKTSEEHPMWTLKMEGDYLTAFILGNGLQAQQQELPPTFVVTGSFYLVSPLVLRSSHSFIGNNTIPLLIDSGQETLDIDTNWDFTMAEAILKLAH